MIQNIFSCHYRHLLHVLDDSSTQIHLQSLVYEYIELLGEYVALALLP